MWIALLPLEPQGFNFRYLFRNHHYEKWKIHPNWQFFRVWMSWIKCKWRMSWFTSDNFFSRMETRQTRTSRRRLWKKFARHCDSTSSLRSCNYQLNKSLIAIRRWWISSPERKFYPQNSSFKKSLRKDYWRTNLIIVFALVFEVFVFVEVIFFFHRWPNL